MVEGIDDRSLLSGVGHVPGTAFPGEHDNVSLAGHRDTHFHPLRKIVRGDTIRVATADGTFLYAVDSSFIVDPDRGDLMDPTGRPMLTLITCYPFGFIGTAPKRFIVRAHGVLGGPLGGRSATLARIGAYRSLKPITARVPIPSPAPRAATARARSA